MGSSILVTVLIVAWDRKQDTLETIKSVHEQAYEDFEIVVVDNGSRDGTVEAVHQAYPAVRVIALDRNVGIAAGRNAGIASARGDIVLCLDSDASLGHDTLTHVVQKFQADPALGVINSKIVNAYTRQFDQIAGWAYTEKNKADQDREFLSFSFSEGGCAIRKEVFDKVGLFWDLLFFGSEGQEFGLRVWDAGYKILYCPEAVVYHRVSPERRIAGGSLDYLLFRNALFIYLLRYPCWMLMFYVPLKTAAVLVRATRRGYLRDVLPAFSDVVRQLPSLWKQRRPISNKTARFYMKLQREHGPLAWDLVSWFKYKT
jgi:GT2 family glycosyltransferase